MTRLTNHGRTALTAATEHAEGLLLPDAMTNKGLPKRAITALLKRGLLEEGPADDGNDELTPEGTGSFCLRITEAGRAAIGGSNTNSSDPDHEREPARGRTNRTTKQATVLKLLTQKTGASLAEIMEATGWQQHSVRGFLSRTVRKKLGMQVTSEPSEKRGRVYRATEA